MTKKEIVKKISEDIGLTQLKTKDIVQRTLDAIIHTLVSEGRIELRNFGVFEVKRRAPRKARNPRTGDKVFVPPKNVVTFKPGKEMEELVRKMNPEKLPLLENAAEADEEEQRTRWTGHRTAGTVARRGRHGRISEPGKGRKPQPGRGFDRRPRDDSPSFRGGPTRSGRLERIATRAGEGTRRRVPRIKARAMDRATLDPCGYRRREDPRYEEIPRGPEPCGGGSRHRRRVCPGPVAALCGLRPQAGRRIARRLGKPSYRRRRLGAVLVPRPALSPDAVPGPRRPRSLIDSGPVDRIKTRADPWSGAGDRPASF